MLSAKEIEDYVYGPLHRQEKKRFTMDEAKQIGDALGIRWTTFDIRQFALGLNVESDDRRSGLGTDVTLDDPMLTGKRALTHLNEIPDYYTQLAAMDGKAERVRPRPPGIGR